MYMLPASAVGFYDEASMIPHGAHWAEMPNLIQKMFLRLYCLDMTFFHTTGLIGYQGFQENY